VIRLALRHHDQYKGREAVSGSYAKRPACKIWAAVRAVIPAVGNCYTTMASSNCRCYRRAATLLMLRSRPTSLAVVSHMCVLGGDLSQWWADGEPWAEFERTMPSAARLESCAPHGNA
jgi:hypothetical protein